MMINYETIVDGISAIVVIFLVATIIAAAWISTNVREQPLIATAVVVFQRQSDGENSEQNSNEEGTRQNSSNNNSNISSSINTTETNIASASATPSVRPKEPKSQIKDTVTMEDKNANKDKEPLVEGKETDILKDKRSSEGNDEGKIEDVEKNKDLILVQEIPSANELKQEKEECPDTCDISESKNVDSTSSSTMASSSIQNDSLNNKTNEITNEMEIRNRRLKHFISMGNQEVLENKSETICTSHMELVENNLYEDSSCKKDTDSKETPDSNKDSSVLEYPSLEALADTDTSEVIENKEEELPPGSIRIRLKFLDDSQRFVHALPTDLIGHFKRQQFSLEISENRRIRLIFNGQLLSSDSSTLAHYGLFDNCVVHCHVSAPQQPTADSPSNSLDLHQEDDDTFMSGLLAPLLYCVLMVMWYLRYQYGHLFNTCSSVILLCLTALLLISTYLLYTTQQQQHQPPPTPTSAPHNSSSTLNTNTVGQITLGAS